MTAPHVELNAFYLVAAHGGFTKAARASAFSRSALSKHVSGLQERCGVRLCECTPFRLTHAGSELFNTLHETRRLLDSVFAAIQREAVPTLRLMAAEVVTQALLPDIAHEVEARHPGLRCSLASGAEAHMHEQLAARAIDAAIAPEHDHWRGASHERLGELPLVLLAPDNCPYTTAAELWARPSCTEILFVPGASPSVVQAFDAGLRGLGVKWNNRRDLSSGFAVRNNVAQGWGYGITVQLPALTSGVKVLPLSQFPRVPIAAYWNGRKTPAHETMLSLLRRLAANLPGAQALSIR